MSDVLQERLQHLVDREDIEECLRVYCRGIDTFDADVMASAFHGDAVIQTTHAPVENPDYTGRVLDYAELVIAHHKHKDAWRRTVVSNLSCSFDGRRADTTVDFVAVVHSAANGGLELTFGRFVGTFAEREGRWRIARHKSLVDWAYKGAAIGQ